MKLRKDELRLLWLACWIAEERMLRGSLKSIDDETSNAYIGRAAELRGMAEKLETEMAKRDEDGSARDSAGAVTAPAMK